MRAFLVSTLASVLLAAPALADPKEGRYDLSVTKKARDVYRDARSGAVILTRYCTEETLSEEPAVLDWRGTYSSKLTFGGPGAGDVHDCNVTAVLSGTPQEARPLLKTQFRTVFKGWAFLDGQNYNLDVPPEGRANIDLPPKMTADGWRCRVLPAKHTPAEKFHSETTEQTIQCERTTKDVGIVYGALQSARASCLHSNWHSDQETMIVAHKTVKTEQTKRTITTTTKVFAGFGIGCFTIDDTNITAAKILLEPMFPEASRL